MLKSLFIQNFALIHEVRITFDAGYTTITGETGSGKSILLNALNLLLGERADFKVIGPKSDKAIVEGEFNIDLKQFQSFFEKNDIDSYIPCIVRREISAQGRSRAFINDVPVQLTILKEFTEQLVSIHSQYNTLELKRKNFQLETLDTLANLSELRANYKLNFKQFQTLDSELKKLEAQLENELKDNDYNSFQLTELESVGLDKYDFETLLAELNRYENGDAINLVSQEIANEIDVDLGLLDRLNRLKALSGKSNALDPKFGELEQRFQSIIVELKDISEVVSIENESIEFNEERKIQLTELLDLYNRLMLKHKCNSQIELQGVYEEYAARISGSENLNQAIEELKAKRILQLEEVKKLAMELSKKRFAAKADIEKRLQNLLADLKLPDTQLVFKLEETTELTSTGNTKLEMLFSANKGIEPVLIENAASGGELSRVMLALQRLISEKRNMPTLFFDEIDTGVSGDVAQKIGVLLQGMGENAQLFAISHLPQVASKAQNHLKVEKFVENEITQTTIFKLSHDERIHEIARLMSGEEINEAAISNAKALMN